MRVLPQPAGPFFHCGRLAAIMNVRLLSAILVSCCAPLLAQTQAPAAASAAASATSAGATQTHSNEIGFTYSIPADWEVVDAQPALPAMKERQTQSATTEEEKKGIACVQVALTARHGNPASVMVVVALPFDCFGQTMTDKDLPGFASGASEGLKKSFDITNPLHASYSLGTHSMWVERAAGSLIGHPEVKFTVETVCSILKKGAVCWMAMLADDAALQIFEHGTVTLDGEAPAALVPAAAFVTKPS